MHQMKDSGIEWIGEIPENVNVLRNKYLIKYIKGRLPSEINTDGAGLPYVGASDLENMSGDCAYTSYTTDATLPVCEEDDVLILWDGARAGLIGTNHKGAISSTIVNAIPNDSILKRFWYWYLKAFQNHLYKCVNGTTIPHMNTDYIEDIAMLDWSMDDQIKIAKYLDGKRAEIDALIAAKEKTNALLKDRRQSIIYEAVTKGLNPDAPMKDSGIEWIGQLPAHWAVERLKPHVEFNPKTEIPEYEEDDSVSFIPMDCLRRGVHTSQTVNYSKVKSGYVDFAVGDILMAKVTPCLENGNLAIACNLIDGVGFGSTEINVIRCKSICREYLFYILQCKTYIERAVADMYGVAGLKRLNPSFIPNTKYPMPSVEEQQTIAVYLNDTCGEIDGLISANEKTIEKLKEYRQSIIYEAVTGKVEV